MLNLIDSNTQSSVKVIAEVGVNHNGDIEIAKELINCARQSGADYVKFQTFKAEKLVTRDAALADYQKSNVGYYGSQFEMLKKLELSEEAHVELYNHCKRVGIKFLSTPFDEDSLDFLLRLGCETIKVSSGDLTNIFLLEAIGRANKPTILSTGMGDEHEIFEATDCLFKNGLEKRNLTLLHCTTEYPCPIEDVNLMAIKTMKNRFNVDIGYSDHTLGIDVAIAAVALGAKVIEKHFTKSRKLDGPDHKASLEPDELSKMISSIRNIERALGDGSKQMASSERKNIGVARKSLVAKRTIAKGEAFSGDNITAKRPGVGLSPMELPRVIGNVAKKNFSEDELIKI